MIDQPSWVESLQQSKHSRMDDSNSMNIQQNGPFVFETVCRDETMKIGCGQLDEVLNVTTLTHLLKQANYMIGEIRKQDLRNEHQTK